MTLPFNFSDLTSFSSLAATSLVTSNLATPLSKEEGSLIAVSADPNHNAADSAFSFIDSLSTATMGAEKHRYILRASLSIKTNIDLLEQLGSVGLAAEIIRPMSGASVVADLSLLRHTPTKSLNDVTRALTHLQRAGTLLHFEKDAVVLPTAVPDDRLFNVQWNLESSENSVAGLNLIKAWDLTLGSADTVIAVIDTGVRFEHEDLTGRLLPGHDFVSGINARRSVAKVPDYLNFVKSHDGDGRDSDATDPGDGVDLNLHALMAEHGIDCPLQESSWHGTAMASLIAANGNDNIGMTGVDWRAQILPVRAIGRCGGRRSDLLDAIRWAAGVEDPALPDNPTPARIINLSLGIDDACSFNDQSAINDAVEAGAIIVAAVGNLSRDLDREPSSPSHCRNVLGVTAVNSSGLRASYSSFGSDADIAAPGGEGASGDNKPIIVATNDGYLEPRNGSSHRYTTGTSVASPLVTGVLSLMLSANPTLSNPELRALLKTSARPFPVLQQAMDCTVDTCGAGLVDAYAAVRSAQQFDPENPGELAAHILEDEPGVGSGGGAAADPLGLLLLGLGIGGYGTLKRRSTRRNLR